MNSTTVQRIPEQLIEQARRADLLELAGRYTELKKNAHHDWQGACPKCGHHENFHVFQKGDEWRWLCYGCSEKPADPIAFLQWVQPGLSFAEAVAQLTGSALPAAAPATKRAPVRAMPARQYGEWRERAGGLVASAQARLWAPEGEAGRAYLDRRSLEPATWQAYGLGYVTDAPVPGTEGKQRAPAIVMPWHAGGSLVAVRFRFLAPQGEQAKRVTSMRGSVFTGRLFGGQALPEFCHLPVDEGRRPAEALRWLLIVEGEINCASCRQVAHETGLDVLSLGSESATLSAGAVQFAQRYGRILVWSDKGEVAQQLMQALPGAYGVRSPGGQDANDLLKTGKLGGFLALARADAAKDARELEHLLWALWDGAGEISGIDGGTAAVLKSLAAKMGKALRLAELEPGRWVQAS